MLTKESSLALIIFPGHLHLNFIRNKSILTFFRSTYPTINEKGTMNWKFVKIIQFKEKKYNKIKISCLNTNIMELQFYFVYAKNCDSILSPNKTKSWFPWIQIRKKKMHLAPRMNANEDHVVEWGVIQNLEGRREVRDEGKGRGVQRNKGG